MWKEGARVGGKGGCEREEEVRGEKIRGGKRGGLLEEESEESRAYYGSYSSKTLTKECFTGIAFQQRKRKLIFKKFAVTFKKKRT